MGTKTPKEKPKVHRKLAAGDLRCNFRLKVILRGLRTRATRSPKTRACMKGIRIKRKRTTLAQRNMCFSGFLSLLTGNDFI
jgi:hypothetical protein